MGLVKFVMQKILLIYKEKLYYYMENLLIHILNTLHLQVYVTVLTKI